MTDSNKHDDHSLIAKSNAGSEDLNSSRKKKKKKPIYSKAVETMFRNAYRAQLDLIALAATKANIMISLNGFIVSVLLVSGSLIYENSPEFIIPTAIFLLTSAASIYFALSSATPDRPARRKKLLPCLFQLMTGKATLKQFREFRNPERKSFDRENSNILVFDDYARVTKEIYLECMDELIHDQEKLYSRMSDHLYTLGKIADKKFTFLRYSYTVFRWGLILSIVSFSIIKSIHHFFPHRSVAATDIIASSNVQSFDRIYEPSGAQGLPDGRLIVIEDEILNAFHVLHIQQDGSFREDRKLSSQLKRSFGTELDDLEAITLGPDGYIYAMTSHQRNVNGERLINREQFIRFKIEGTRVVDASAYGKLVDAIEKSGILGKLDEQGHGGIYNINIESLSFDKNNHLMIGFREPLDGEKTVIGIMENPAEVFEYKAEPVISSKPLSLNLHGGGIRAMSFDSTLDGYLISNEIYGIGKNDKQKHSQMLFWDGNKSHRAHHMNIPDMKNIEGITSVRLGNENSLLVVSDDGEKTGNKTANYLILKYKELSAR